MRGFPVFVLLSVLISSAAHGQDAAEAEMKRKLVLAQQYEDLTKREQRIEAGFADQLRLIWDGCTDDPCRVALDQAIKKAISEGAPEHERATVKMFASHLTEDELHAAIAFAQTPQGRAIVAAEFEMSGDLAVIAHSFSKGGYESVRHTFCATQPAACTRALARLAEKSSSRP